MTGKRRKLFQWARLMKSCNLLITGQTDQSLPSLLCLTVKYVAKRGALIKKKQLHQCAAVHIPPNHSVAIKPQSRWGRCECFPEYTFCPCRLHCDYNSLHLHQSNQFFPISLAQTDEGFRDCRQKVSYGSTAASECQSSGRLPTRQSYT